MRLHHLTTGQEVVELVGAPELDIGLDRHRVVALHERVQELAHRDRLSGRITLREVVTLEDARNRRYPRETDDIRVRQLGEPLAVVTNLGAVRIDDLERLLLVRPRVGVDLLIREERSFGATSGRVADACRVVADDENTDVPRVLERAHPLQGNAAAEMDVGRRHVDAELDAQRPPERELAFELAFRQHVNCVPRQLCDVGHGR